MIYGTTLILLGLMAVPSLLLSKKPKTKKLFDKITPFQRWIGVVFAFWGISGYYQQHSEPWFTQYSIFLVGALASTYRCFTPDK